ncbi:MAG TPA: 2-oxoglutarate dehydrogenase complex dihydrolipoyllysine-residue succinyltransferase [Gammaproteobacteria bacterium]|nr:2-oxoglutarate dehydrogenase complex dihydrolipoyllysine-residue succinyltransferase [Gammaproteobacteria bacterium]
MAYDIKVPVLPESVADATIAAWHKKPGDPVRRDETLVDIETDKIVLEVVAPADGTLEKILKDTGAVVKAEEVIATFVAQQNAAASAPVQTKQSATTTQTTQAAPQQAQPAQQKPEVPSTSEQILSPSMRRAVGEGVATAQPPAPTQAQSAPQSAKQPAVDTAHGRLEKRVPMTRLRAKIAERLLAAQQNAAILTTFNEINMGPVITLRNTYKEEFMQKYGVRLGYMSFFVNAVVAALKRFPDVNASIDGNDIVYHGYFDIGIAVSTERGLVVPVLRDADTLTVAEIEQKIADFSKSARDGKLSMEDITGGTFTITNGGVFGSLMATPILNPPQSAILGMHKIEERPVVENKQIVIRPMMYVALSYDHRIIDGAESVQFLVTVKEMLEDPARLILSI